MKICRTCKWWEPHSPGEGFCRLAMSHNPALDPLREGPGARCGASRTGGMGETRRGADVTRLRLQPVGGCKESGARNEFTRMKRLATLALLLASAAAVQAETSSYLAPYGSWQLCASGQPGPFCASRIARGTYALFIKTDTQAVGFRYSLTVRLADGSTQNIPQRIITRGPGEITLEYFVFPSPVVVYEQHVEPLGVIAE